MQTVQALGLLHHRIQHRVSELSAFGVVALGPVASGASLLEDGAAEPEQLIKKELYPCRQLSRPSESHEA